MAAWLPRNGRVVIVPDGALNNLDFETMPVPGERRRYWIEDVEIAVAPSLGLLSAGVRPSRAGNRGVLLVGDPLSNDARFPKLRYASAEIEAVSKAFGGGYRLFVPTKRRLSATRRPNPASSESCTSPHTLRLTPKVRLIQP